MPVTYLYFCYTRDLFAVANLHVSNSVKAAHYDNRSLASAACGQFEYYIQHIKPHNNHFNIID